MKTQLEKIANIKLEKKDGGLYYNGNLDLSGTAITSLPDNLTVGGSLYIRGTAITSLPDNLTVGGWLDLEGTAITSLPDNLTVGGSLYISGTGITSLPDNLTVGGWLDIRGTAITSLPDNLTVGGSLYISGTGIIDTSNINRIISDNYLFSWQCGKYVKADGIFTEVVKKRGNVYHVKKVNTDKIFYLITDGNGKFSHGDTIAEAKEDLLYKINGKNKDDYKYLTLQSKLTHEEAIVCYRVITGACSFGTKDFINNRLPKKQTHYTVGEIIKLTNGEYGNNTFTNFFKNN